MGESAKRDEWGINTVIVARRGAACPKCLQYVGRVFYDDVYGNIPVPDDKYPRLSAAIAGGLYHPNCKDIHTTYFEGVSTPPKPLTSAQEKRAAEIYDLEQRQRYNERQIRKFRRLSENTLDPEQKQKYTARLKQWEQVNADFVEAHGDVLKRRYEREDIRELAVRVEKPPVSAKKSHDKSGGSGIIKNENITLSTVDEQHISNSGIWDKIKSIFSKPNNKIEVTEEDIKTALGDIGFRKVEHSFFEKVDKPLQLSITDQLKSLEDEFGAIKGSAFPRISAESINGVACVRHDVVKTADQRLILSNKHFKSRKSHISARKKDVKSFYCMPCNIDDETLSRYVVTHEYGHMLEGILIQKDLVGRFGAPKDVAARYKREIISKAKDIDPNFDIKEHLSEYGEYNDKGFFAECFANSQLGKPNLLGLAMQKWLLDRGF